jgi:inorganic pyrophosphatase
MTSPFLNIPPREPRTRLVNVIIDTPRGSRNKFKFDEKLGCFKLSRILPAGHVFPHDFGSIPGTRGEDGDALDVLVLMDEPAFPGCLITARLIGVIVACQTEQGRTISNDRLIGVPQTLVNKPIIRELSDLGTAQLDLIEHFLFPTMPLRIGGLHQCADLALHMRSASFAARSRLAHPRQCRDEAAKGE